MFYAIPDIFNGYHKVVGCRALGCLDGSVQHLVEVWKCTLPPSVPGVLLFRFYITKQTNKQSKTVLGSQEPLVDSVISGVLLFGFYFTNFLLVCLGIKQTNKPIPRLKPYKMTARVCNQAQSFLGDFSWNDNFVKLCQLHWLLIGKTTRHTGTEAA